METVGAAKKAMLVAALVILSGSGQARAQGDFPMEPSPRPSVRADSDGDGVLDALDNCPYWRNAGQEDRDGNGVGSDCECGDQDGSGHVDVRDLAAINRAIFIPALATPLCDANFDHLCDVWDLIGANRKIFGAPAYCQRLPPTATLEGSLDWGDLGPDYETELPIYGDELLFFRWKINAPSAAKGRWEIVDSSEALLAQGEVGAPNGPGSYNLFSLNVDGLNLSPPFKVRIQALSSSGSEVGHVSPPVIIKPAVDTGVGTCFTDGGLGLPITDKLEMIRAANGVPALGGAIVTKYGLEAFDAVGVRKLGANPVSVTKYDSWHLGSDTKAMTSMLVGILKQQFPFSVGWSTTIADAFPEWVGTMDPTMAQTTLRELLAHRSGLYLITEDQWAKLVAGNLSVGEQRRAFAHAVVHDPHLMAPGVLFKYENGNYVIAGAMLENLFHKSWENLITQYLFQPLGMTSAGFGSPAQGGQPQPWGHYDTNGAYVPTAGDNSPSLGPAGTVHASLEDWAKFIRLYLAGHEGGVSLTPGTLSELTTPYASSDPWFVVWPQTYGWGWGMFGTSGDRGLGHDGSNMSWYARAVVYLDRGYALLAVTNAAVLGDVNHGMEAVGAVVNLLEAHHSDCPDNARKTRFFSPPGISSGSLLPGLAAEAAR